MFKFLFGKKSVEAVKETQRETVTRAMGEVNSVLGGMAVKAKIAVNLETGLLEIELPEQMPDEALALPAPKSDMPQAKAKPDQKPDAKSDAAKPDDAKPADTKPGADASKAASEAVKAAA